MKNSTNAIGIEKKELLNSTYSFNFSETQVVDRKGKIKSRLAFVYFIALVSSIAVLFLR